MLQHFQHILILLNTGPYPKTSGKAVGKDALAAVNEVITNVLSLKDLKAAAKSISKETGDNSAHKALNPVQSMMGQGKKYPVLNSSLCTCGKKMIKLVLFIYVNKADE
ncbi:hypothetical protein CDAR_586071 [Caerostris darwini]|uniref:Variable large protein n=1 Tax=Caerostris darwini TaxID=1538125 RepID=A0AAV4UX26_9ARAC|nr:hypothetical protein CDAR_586071 [Caerostris darwini]